MAGSRTFQPLLRLGRLGQHCYVRTSHNSNDEMTAHRLQHRTIPQDPQPENLNNFRAQSPEIPECARAYVRTYVHAVSVKHGVHDAHAVPDVPCVHDAPDVSDTYVRMS